MKTSTLNGYKVNLIESLEDIETMKSHFSKDVNVGLDTETEGLDYNIHKVVGYCISGGKSYSKQDYEGYYLPVRHTIASHNLPLDKVIETVQWSVDNFKQCLFNRNFDFTMAEKDGVDFSKSKSHDVQIMCHLVLGDPYPSLKDEVKKYLKFDVIDFVSNGAVNHNFGTTDPTISYVYAAQDPLITVLLGRKIWAEYPYIRQIYPLDNKVAEVVRKLCLTTNVYLDKKIIKDELDRVCFEQAKTQQEIFAVTGYPFKLNSSREKGDALNRFVTLTAKTAKGQWKVDSETLSKIDHPLAHLLVKYAELEKYRGSYLAKMLEFSSPFKVSYSTVNVSTGRLSSGGQKNNSFFANLNIQNIPKVQVKRFVHRDEQLGYVINDDPEGALGTMSAKGGLRDAFVTESDDWVWLSADYSGQELRCAANFSGEPNFINPILEGKDLHMHVAKQMFGFEDPEHRTNVKTLNFGVLYGAQEFTVARKLNKTVQEAKDLLNRYFATMKRLYQWQQEQIKEGRRKGFVFTYFGRPRAVFQYYNQAGMQGFADRTCLNSPIQGCTPLQGYLELEHSCVTMSSVLGKRVYQKDRREVVPTHRGGNPPLMVIFNTGDFAVCDINHQFITGSLVDPKIASVRDGLYFKGKPQKILQTPLRKRKYGFTKLMFKDTFKALSLLRLVLTKGDEVLDNNAEVASCLFNLAFHRTWFELNYLQIIRVRALVSLFGYNVIYSPKHDKFRVTFSKAKKVKVSYYKCLDTKDVQVGSCTALQGYQLYENQGIWTKNTGGDLIRIKLCQMWKDLQDDPDLGENVKFICTVHDEINVAVRVTHLKKAFYWLRDLMYFKPSNFQVPLVAELSVGRTWGHQVTCEDISDDNKIILPEYEE